MVTHPTRHLSLMTGTIYVSPQPCRITSWHLNKRLGSSVCFCEEPVLLWRQKELTSSLSPSGLPGRLRQRDHPGAQEQVCEASFSLRWLWQRSAGQTQKYPRGEDAQIKWQTDLCKFQSCGLMGASLLVSTSGEMAPYLSITLKHTSKRKISSGLLVCLLYSLLDFPKGFLNTVWL